MPQIEVTLDVDANGILHVKAKDKNTGKENKITIKSDSGLSKEQIAEMIRDAEANAEADKKQKEIIEARNQAEAALHSFRTDLKESGDKITEEQRTKIESAIAELDSAIKGEDKEAITKATQELFTAAIPLMEAKNKTEEKANTTDDNVVDAEFTETKTEK